MQYRKRQHIKQEHPLSVRFLAAAESVRRRAQDLPEGPERSRMLLAAREAEVAAELSRELSRQV